MPVWLHFTWTARIVGPGLIAGTEEHSCFVQGRTVLHAHARARRRDVPAEATWAIVNAPSRRHWPHMSVMPLDPLEILAAGDVG